MAFKILSDFPDGYIKKEKEFCKKEEVALFSSKLPHDHPDKSILRNRLLSKRAEFKRIYYK